MTWESLSAKYGITVSKLRTAYASWIASAPESQPKSPTEIHFKQRSPGRPCPLGRSHELVIAQAVRYFADNSTPLTKQGVLDLTKQYIDMLPLHEQKKAGFHNNRPSLKFCDNFLARHILESRSVRQVEDSRVDAITMEKVTEHIARVQAAMDRYHINDPRFIFNMDQTGSSFEKIIGRSLRKGVGRKGQHLIQKTIRTKGDLVRVTVMPVVSAAGKAYTPCVIFPGKTPHYRIVKGQGQTLHNVWMDCLLYHRDPPGADSEIVFDWAKSFVKETESLRRNKQHLLLILDGYSAHLQFRTLDLFRKNNIITIALPSHSSHELQPLDVTVFGAFKSYLQRELHMASQTKKIFNAFDIASMLHNAYSLSFVAPNIREGFFKCGLWDPDKKGTNLSTLERLFENKPTKGSVQLSDLLKAFTARHRSLLRDASVDEEGGIAIDTKSGAHITSEIVIGALRKRELQRRKQLSKAQQLSDEAAAERRAYKEPAADIRRLVELSDERAYRRKHLRQSREYRRLRQKTVAASKKPFQVTADATSPINFGVIRRAKPCEIR